MDEQTQPSFYESIDPVLLKRLLRPLHTPGVLSFALARRIFAWVDFFSGRLALMSDLSKRWGRGGKLRVNEVPLVHARWVTNEAMPARASTQSTKVVTERLVVRAAPAPQHRDEGMASTMAKAPAPSGSGPVSSAVAAAPMHYEKQSELPGVTPSAREPFPSPQEPTRATPTPVLSLQEPAREPPTPLPAQQKALPTASTPLLAQQKALPTASTPLPAQQKALPTASTPLPAQQEALPTGPTSFLAQQEARPSAPTSILVTQEAHQSASGPIAPLPIVTPNAAQSPSPPSPADLPQATRPRVSARPRPRALPPDLPLVRTASPVSGATTAPEPPTSARVVRAVPAAVHTPESNDTAKTTTRANPTPAQTPNVDIENLVDKVERKLLRRIAAERDRRGGFG